MRSKLRSSVTVKDILPSDKENAFVRPCKHKVVQKFRKKAGGQKMYSNAQQFEEHS